MLATIDTLLKADIGVHTALHGGIEITYGLHDDVLRWLDTTLRPGMVTLETGSGLSTIIFAARGTDHTCVAPFEDEFARLRAWCLANGVDTSRVRFVVGHSEIILPTLECDALDLVLIDGSHSFPHVFIDWFYASRALRVGGVVIVDDTQIWTGHILSKFLAEEPGWKVCEKWPGRTTAFEKVQEMDPAQSWTQQPYVLQRSEHTGGLRSLSILLQRGEVRQTADRLADAARRRLHR